MTHTRAALPPLDPPALLVVSLGLRMVPLALVKLLPDKQRSSHAAFPKMWPPIQHYETTT